MTSPPRRPLKGGRRAELILFSIIVFLLNWVGKLFRKFLTLLVKITIPQLVKDLVTLSTLIPSFMIQLIRVRSSTLKC